VPGVKSITSEVMSPAQLAQYDLAPTPADLRQAAHDSWLAMATRLRLLADPNVPALDVGVDAWRGGITLFGLVPTATARAAAEADARGVDDTATVKDELQVVPSARRSPVDAKDEAVQKSVRKALATRREFKHVAVEVKAGVARLTGTVESSWERLKAGLITRAQKGVRAVEDDLRV
jgi:osmotically-inducible protein OsmY